MRIKRILKNIMLMTSAIILALGLGELSIRLIRPVYDARDQSLLFSSPNLKIYPGGSVRYAPNEKIREVTIYNQKIEYDVLYATNNLGFIDSMNYRYEAVPGKSYYAFVGDSFTAGVHGGSPWVPKLRNNKTHAEVYNFGVTATGFDHFYRLLHDMKDKVKITHIVIVAITDDFFRTFWHPVEIDGMINFCGGSGIHQTCRPIPVGGVIPINASEREVKEISRKTYREIRARVNEINAANGWQAKLESLLYDDSAIYYYTKLLLDTYKRSHQPSNIEDAYESMRKIRNEFPAAEIHLIHLPQKYEVKTKNYYINIADQVAELGIKYYPALEKCGWSDDMFFVRNNHPNKYGYENITKCVSDYLSF